VLRALCAKITTAAGGELYLRINDVPGLTGNGEIVVTVTLLDAQIRSENAVRSESVDADAVRRGRLR
jgi:hypothetical protein